MVEYAIISGKNFWGDFLNAIGPTINPIQVFLGKIGLNLSVAETGFLAAALIAVIVGSLIVLILK